MDNKNDNQNNYDPMVIPEDVKKLLGIKDEKKEVKNNDIFSTEFHVLKKRQDQFESEKDEEQLKKDMADLALTFKEKKAIYDLDLKPTPFSTQIKKFQSSILESVYAYDKAEKKYKPQVSDSTKNIVYASKYQTQQIAKIKSGIFYKNSLKLIIKRNLIEIKSWFNNLSKNIKKPLNNLKLKFYAYIFNLNLTINKKLFLMSLSKEKRESLKGMTFDPHNFNNNSEIVKLILKKNVNIKKIKKSAEKMNRVDFEPTIKTEKRNKVQKFSFGSNNKNDLLFE